MFKGQYSIRKRTKELALLSLFTIGLFSCDKEVPIVPEIDPSEAGHPRILLLEDEEQEIKDNLETNPTLKKIHDAIIEESDRLLTEPVLERVMIGRRLLDVSRKLLRRSFYLSYSFRITGDSAYLKKAEKELVSVCSFTDWNPSHFLDVAEMTMGVAIGYDWLFEGLKKDSRELIKSAIVEKGINPSYNSDYNWFLRSDFNWNQVCNAGMTFGALAVKEDYPDLASDVIDRSFNSLLFAMYAYLPDGAWKEGYIYWEYGTTFNVLFLSAIEKELGHDRGLVRNHDGFLKSANFIKHTIAPSGYSFNWADCPVDTYFQPAMFWFADYMDNPSILWSEKKILDNSTSEDLNSIRFLPAAMIWGRDLSTESMNEPEDKFWIGHSESPVAMMRTSWTNPDAKYLGFKAGSPWVVHNHMDIGSFIIESDGIRWAVDLGKEDYETLESQGLEIFAGYQSATRWTIFRMGTYSHNVLIVNNEQQRVTGSADIDKFSNEDSLMYAVSDLSSIYDGLLTSATRGVALADSKYFIVRDEIETLDQPTTIRWNMVTYADVTLNGNEAILSEGGKNLIIKVHSSESLEMKTWSTEPSNDYEADNTGTIMVGFESVVAANTSAEFEVLLIPESSIDNAKFLNLKLEKW